MKFSSFVVSAAYLLEVGHVSAQILPVPQPLVPGIYHLINRVNDASGNKLAITANGVNAAITVTPFVFGQVTQLWNITGTSGIFTIQALNGNGVVEPAIGALRTGPALSNTWASFFDIAGDFTFNDTAQLGTSWMISTPTNLAQLFSESVLVDFTNFWQAIRFS